MKMINQPCATYLHCLSSISRLNHIEMIIIPVAVETVFNLLHANDKFRKNIHCSILIVIRAPRAPHPQRTELFWKDEAAEQWAALGLISVVNRGSWSCVGFGRAAQGSHA